LGTLSTGFLNIAEINLSLSDLPLNDSKTLLPSAKIASQKTLKLI